MNTLIHVHKNIKNMFFDDFLFFVGQLFILEKQANKKWKKRKNRNGYVKWCGKLDTYKFWDIYSHPYIHVICGQWKKFSRSLVRVKLFRLLSTIIKIYFDSIFHNNENFPFRLASSSYHHRFAVVVMPEKFLSSMIWCSYGSSVH